MRAGDADLQAIIDAWPALQPTQRADVLNALADVLAPPRDKPAKKLPKLGDARYVFAELPRCPTCGSSHLRAYHSQRDAEAVQRHSCCQACGAKFILILE